MEEDRYQLKLVVGSAKQAIRIHPCEREKGQALRRTGGTIAEFQPCFSTGISFVSMILGIYAAVINDMLRDQIASWDEGPVRLLT